MLTDIQKELFWEEVNLVQKRHSIFFPDDQLKKIILRQTDSGDNLALMQGHQIPLPIMLEIQFVFKLQIYFLLLKFI